MKQYCGRFPVNMALTKALGYEDFVVYRDPKVGLYAYSKKYDLDVNLQDWNETLASVTAEGCSTLEYWAELITDAICRER